MSAPPRDRVEVFLDAGELGPCRRIGTLRRVGGRADPPIAFAYEQAWVDDPNYFVLEPGHQPHPGDQFPSHGRLAGIFTDASPDRWGRMLLERREAERARAEGRQSHQLGEWEFLLGVSDLLRMGALRFAAAEGAPFLDDDPLSVPPVTELRELEQAAHEIEHPSDRRNQPNLERAIALLLAPGSPLGGARPKTTFRLEDGALWMAKFPSPGDRRDVGAWEYVLNQLAQRAGVHVPEARLMRFAGSYHTFAARRFDRDGESRRLYASAMTLVGKQDHEPASYIEIAQAIRDYGARKKIRDDLAQLFRRLVFNILTGHRDDHLRNHGFLRSEEGWRLAPAFDLNPMPDMADHDLAVGLDSHAPDLGIAVTEAAPFCDLAPAEAESIVDEVRIAIVDWRDLAITNGVPSDEIDLVGQAFDSARPGPR